MTAAATLFALLQKPFLCARNLHRKEVLWARQYHFNPAPSSMLAGKKAEMWQHHC
jgi:hypothetical protein